MLTAEAGNCGMSLRTGSIMVESLVKMREDHLLMKTLHKDVFTLHNHNGNGLSP